MLRTCDSTVDCSSVKCNYSLCLSLVVWGSTSVRVLMTVSLYEAVSYLLPVVQNEAQNACAESTKRGS